jgi:hypothetical protein
MRLDLLLNWLAFLAVLYVACLCVYAIVVFN